MSERQSWSPISAADFSFWEHRQLFGTPGLGSWCLDSDCPTLHGLPGYIWLYNIHKWRLLKKYVFVSSSQNVNVGKLTLPLLFKVCVPFKVISPYYIKVRALETWSLKATHNLLLNYSVLLVFKHDFYKDFYTFGKLKIPWIFWLLKTIEKCAFNNL